MMWFHRWGNFFCWLEGQVTEIRKDLHHLIREVDMSLRQGRRIEEKLDDLAAKITPRQGARLTVRPVGAEEPRGSTSSGGSTHMQIHSGKQVRFLISATDVDGNPAEVSDPRASSADPTIVAVTQNPDNPAEFIVGDPPGAGLGTTTVQFGANGLSTTETIEIIAGDAVAIVATAGAEEDRTP